MSTIKLSIGPVRIDGENAYYNTVHLGKIKDIKISLADEQLSKSYIFVEPNGKIDVLKIGRELQLYGVSFMCAEPGKEIQGTYQVPCEDETRWMISLFKDDKLEEYNLWG